MPRKQQQAKQTITVVVNGDPIKVGLHPPTEKRKAWYAYWAGCVYSRSTNQTDLTEAIRVAESMVKNGGKQVLLSDAVLSDEEFEAIQRAHFAKRTDPASKVRAEKSLESCLESIAAFKKLAGLPHAAMATADDCARFQVEALKLPNNWRREYPKGRTDAECLSANTVLKWCRSLQAAFERANRNAGKKCVRGVIVESKLLNANPWAQFTWIEGTERPIRQFDADDLLSFLTFLETEGRKVPVAALAAKVFLWSCCRKHEVAGLEWKQARLVMDDQRVVVLGDSPPERLRIKEAHFHVVGKWGVERWFRVPETLFHDLLVQRRSSPFVFAAYTDQIRIAHADW